MSILVDEGTRVIVQGITGRDGAFHAKQMKSYGTNVVGGVTPGKGGEFVDDIPVFNTVFDAVLNTDANTSIIFVPARFGKDAIMEAVDAGIKLIVTITEGIPIKDMLEVTKYMEGKDVRLIGPNCPGLISPGKSKVGILPAAIFKEGKVGVISRSGTLTYEVVKHLTDFNLGESTCIGIGGDPIIGLKFIDLLEMFENDLQTEAVVIIGEIGGSDEEDAAEFTKKRLSKPTVFFIAGRTAPMGKRMGHAGAIVSSGTRTADEKISYIEELGIPVAKTPFEVAEILNEKLR